MANRRQPSSVFSRLPRRKSRTYNLRLIRRDYSFTVQEIAELFRVHPNAVRRWVKGGLRTIDSHRPQLIHGTDLIEYLDGRQRGRKRRCAPDQMFCFTCREPRRPAGGCVALVQLSPRWMVQGPCQICGTQMNRASSARRFAELERTFTVTIASPRLSGLADPVVMCDLEKDDDDA
jgi:hypothetical protein